MAVLTSPPPPSSSSSEGTSTPVALRDSLASHPVYASLESLEHLRFFMERHVICVWDFMSLLKSLQIELTCVSWPWTPPLDAAAARLVNEIVLGEETDEIRDGRYLSHFEWYLEAMDEVGADREPIDRFVTSLRRGSSWQAALQSSGLPKEARAFAETTLRFAGGPLHVRASAFFHGREALIPLMFVELVRRLRDEGHPCGVLNDYLDRHIEVDGGEHGPMAERLLERLIDDEPTRAREAEQAAVSSLRARHTLWSSIHRQLTAASEGPSVERQVIRSFWRRGR